MPLSETTMQLLATLAIIAAGFLATKLGNALILAISKRREIINVKNLRLIKIFRYAMMIITILAALIYLQADIIKDLSLVTDFISATYNLLPTIFMVLLLVVLAITVINLITFALSRAFDAAGINEFFIEEKKEYLITWIFALVRVALYISTGIFLLNLFGVNVEGITSAIGWFFYAILALLFLYIFFGTRIFAENFLAGIYLKVAKTFKLGQRVAVGNIEGSIKSITNQGVVIKSEDGMSTFIPNREFIKKEISFKNIETDLDTLEKIKSYYVEQKPSYCGPASASMVLKIFGFNETQSKIGEMSNTQVGKGTHPQVLINVVQELTQNKVKGAWVDVDHMTDLKDEIRLWLSEGALIIIDYKKNMLFPESKTAHYSVCVAVEGDELVILDPSGKKGGVYLADAEKVYRGMDTYSELIKGKRGYIALAPEGTTAFYRIGEGLIYTDPSLYKDLSNKLMTELHKLTEKSGLLETVLPLRVKNFMKKWREKDKIARLWRPNSDL